MHSRDSIWLFLRGIQVSWGGILGPWGKIQVFEVGGIPGGGHSGSEEGDSSVPGVSRSPVKE